MNRATRSIVTTLGVLLGISGMNHGFFEALQGYIPTPGLIVQAIGSANRFWVHGTEEAFTIVPNFLITGLLAIMVGVAIIVWSIRFVHQKNGSRIFILLCILLFLVGGGIGQIIFFTLAWAVATRINRPLTGWRKILPERVRKALSTIWPVSLAVGSLLFSFALEIAIFGFVPGVADPEQRLYICWGLLGISLVTFFLTIVSGFAQDIQAAA